MELIIDVDEKLVCSGFERPFTEEERDTLIRAIGNGKSYNPSSDCISRSILKGLISAKSIPIKFEEDTRGNWQHSSGVLLSDVYRVIDNIPPIEPERPKGEWIKTPDLFRDRICSHCKQQIPYYKLGKFCVECGADMQKGDAE